MPPYYVEALMGHAGKGVTGTYYDRPSIEMMARAVADAWKNYLDNGGSDFVI
jgi:hypothetical protein